MCGDMAYMSLSSCRATYLAGELLCSPDDMVRLSAILCQIAKGDYSTLKWVHINDYSTGNVYQKHISVK